MTSQADTLNKLPEVRWDRTAGTDGPDGARAVYGWVDKPGSVRADFVVVLFAGDEPEGLVTSSTRWSADFSARLGFDDHQACVPVETHYGDRLGRIVRRASTLDPSILGQ